MISPESAGSRFALPVLKRILLLRVTRALSNQNANILRAHIRLKWYPQDGSRNHGTGVKYLELT